MKYGFYLIYDFFKNNTLFGGGYPRVLVQNLADKVGRFQIHKVMAKNTIVYLIACFAITISACRPEQAPLLPTGIIEMNFKVLYDGEPVVFQNGSYRYADGKPISFEKFNFYISNIVLLSADGNDETDIFDIKLVDLSDTSAVAAAAGRTFSRTGIPVGEYGGVRFDLGVPDASNSSGGFPEGKYFGAHPLNHRDQYSETFKSYMFMRLEGLYGDNQEFFRFRPGTRQLLFENLDFPAALHVSETAKTPLHFEVDLKDLLQVDGEYLNLSTTYELDETNMETLGYKLLDNLKSGLTMQ